MLPLRRAFPGWKPEGLEPLLSQILRLLHFRIKEM